MLDISRAIAAGYTSRPVADTMRDTLEWWATLTEEDRPGGRPRAGPRKRGMPPPSGPPTMDTMLQIEAELIEA